MIPKSFIIEWAGKVPWAEPRQIEQDLIITRALIELYKHPILKKSLAFRGGTALNKLIFNPPSRYSEDIDLVQITSEPIGSTINLIREVIDPWLGSPKRSSSDGGITLSYRTMSDDEFPIKLKLEINTREHFAVLGFQEYVFSSSSSWHSGTVTIMGYKLEELLGTKMRALYQRRKGRDLYDLYMALTLFPTISFDEVVHCFVTYLRNSGNYVSRKEFIENIEKKMTNKEFQEDILPLLPQRVKSFDPEVAYLLISTTLLKKL